MSTGSQPSATHSTRSQRALIGTAIVVFAVISAYLALVIITRVDGLFFPSHQLTLPGAVGKILPGVDAEGKSGVKDRINIMVMGLDRRPREGDEPARTDTLFVITVDPKTKSTGILGIPRDLRVDIPGRNGGTFQDRVNSVYVNGEVSHTDGGGVGLMKQVMKDNFNIRIDKYVIIDFKGFESIIDDLGGIDVDVPDEVYDPYYSETELPGDYLPQHFYPGKQHMDGQTALAYSRIRFSSDDLDRIQRQQRVIFAAIDKAKDLNVLKNAPSLWSKYKDAIHTDISDFQIPDYALLANEVKDNIHAVSLGPATAPYTDPRSGAALLIGNAVEIKKIVESLFVDKPDSAKAQPTVTPEPVSVQVQNGTGSEGLASRVVAYIASKGYPVNNLNASNVFDGEARTASEIIDLDGSHEKNAYLIADWLQVPIGRVRTANVAEKAAMASGGAKIVIILGADVDFDQQISSPATNIPGG